MSDSKSCPVCGHSQEQTINDCSQCGWNYPVMLGSSDVVKKELERMLCTSKEHWRLRQSQLEKLNFISNASGTSFTGKYRIKALAKFMRATPARWEISFFVTIFIMAELSFSTLFFDSSYTSRFEDYRFAMKCALVFNVFCLSLFYMWLVWVKISRSTNRDEIYFYFLVAILCYISQVSVFLKWF